MVALYIGNHLLKTLYKGEIMIKNNRQKGSHYEEVAALYLQQQGYRILEKNYRCKLGEIDLIGLDNNAVVFIEVKYREKTTYGHPFFAVTKKKQRTIYQVANYYLSEKKLSYYGSYRFDVVGILGDKIQLLKNAFGGM